MSPPFSPESIDALKNLLGDGSRFGVDLSFAVQEKPRGLPEALVIAQDFLDGHPSVLALGDNVFHGQGLGPNLRAGLEKNAGCMTFLYEVPHPASFGVVGFNSDGSIADLEEKPAHPKSNWIVTGLYVFDQSAPILAKSLKPSERGELEIVDLLKLYLEQGQLSATKLERGTAWMDVGTPDSLLSASEYFRLIDQRQKRKVAVLEEIGFRNNWIDAERLIKSAELFANTEYGSYLHEVATEG